MIKANPCPVPEHGPVARDAANVSIGGRQHVF